MAEERRKFPRHPPAEVAWKEEKPISTMRRVLFALTALVIAARSFAAPPANDHYAAAIELGNALPVTLAGTCAEATVEAGEYNGTGTFLVGGIHSSVWYRWTSPVSGWVGGTLPAGVSFAPYQDGPVVPDRSRAIRNIGVYYANPWLPVRVTAGQVLTFQVAAGLGAVAGPFSFTLTTVPPPNDGPAFGGAADLPRAPSVSVTSTNIGATVAPGEVLPPGANVGSTVYFLLDAYGAFPCEITTTGSAIDTVLAVYTFDQAALLSWNDDAAPGDLSSHVTFTPSASSVFYVIQVSGYSGQQGEFQLQVNYTLPPGPVHDARAAAVDLGNAAPVSFSVVTHAATSEPGEVLPGGLRRTLWYRWTAPAAGAWKLDGSYTLGNESPAFTVCREVPGLPAVEDVVTHGLPAVFRAAAGESFLISVGGRLGYAGYEIASTISLTSAEAAVVENFDATSSGPLSGQGGATGGWGGPWAYDPARNSFGDVFSPSQAATALSALSVAGSMGDPGGRQVMMPAVNGTVSLRRPLATPVGLEATYFSFLLRTDSTAAGAYAGIRLRPSNGNTHTFAGKPGAGQTGKWVIEDLGGDNQQSFQSFPVVPGRAARLVVRTDFGTMRAWSEVAPDMPQFYYQHNAYSPAAQGVSSLGLYANAACFLDDVRTGPTWESVTQPVVEAPVIFNEVCTRTPWDFNGDGVASESEDAYCELVNRSSVPQDVSGQGIWRGTVLSHVFPAGTVLQPRQAIVVFGGGSITEGVTGAFGNAWVQRASSGGIGAPLMLRSTAATSAAVLCSFADNHAFTPATRWPELIGSAWAIWRHNDTRFVPGGHPGSPGQRVNLTPWLPLSQALTASISRGSVVEGAGWNAATLTVSRPGSLAEPLTVQVRSSHPALVNTSPDYAVIPAGEPAVTVPLSFYADFTENPNLSVTLTVIGSGYFNGTATVTVLESDRRIYINEINAQSNGGGGGADFGEFIEHYDGGLGFKSLHDFIVVLFDADAVNDGAYRVIDLAGRMTGSTGFFVMDSNAFPELSPGWLTNGGGAVAIYKKRTGNGMGGGAAVPPYYDFPPGTAPVVNANLVDAITHVTDDAPDLALVALFTPAGSQADEGSAPNPPATLNVSTGRCPDARAPFDSGAFRQSMPTPGSSNLTYPGFATWAATRGITSMTGDDDADGLDNLLEYALGGDPADASSQHLLPGPLDNPFNELRMFIRKGAEAGHDPRLRWDVEASTDMIHWTTRGVVIVQEDCATLTAAFIGATPRVQMRLKVTSVP